MPAASASSPTMKMSSAMCLTIVVQVCCLPVHLHLLTCLLLLLLLGFYLDLLPGTLCHPRCRHRLPAMVEVLLLIGSKVAGCVLPLMQEMPLLMTLACSSIGNHSTLGHSASHPAAVPNPGFLLALASGLQQLPPPV